MENKEGYVEERPMLNEQKPMLGKLKRPKCCAGFWLRAGAFIADLFLLGFFMYFLTFIAKEALLGFGKSSIYFSFAIIFLYFALLNGPIGKGKTPGKILFSISVTDAELNTISFISAVKRTIIQLNPFIIVIFILQPFFDDPSSLKEQFIVSFIPLLLLSFNVANMVFLATNPLRQGFHDIIAGSYVQPDSQKITYQTMQEKIGELFYAMKKSASQAGLTVILVVILVGTYLTYRNTFSADAQKLLDERLNFKKSCRIENFKIEVHTEKRKVEDAVEKKEPNVLEKMLPDKSSTDTAQAPQGEENFKVVLIFDYFTFIPVADTFFKSESLDKKLEEITLFVREKIQEDIETQAAELIKKKEYDKLKRFSQYIGTEEIEFNFVKRLDLILYSYNQILYKKTLRLNVVPPAALKDLEAKGVFDKESQKTN